MNTSIPATVIQTLEIIPTITHEADGQVTFMAVGDVMLGRRIGELIQSGEIGKPFSEVADIFNDADWVVANLECAITDSKLAEKKVYTFSAPAAAAVSLADAGINVVSLSNNHSLDYGSTGLSDTIKALENNSIQTFGVGRNSIEARTPLFLNKNGLKIALLGYTDVTIESASYFDTHSWIADGSHPGLAWAVQSDIEQDVATAKQQADVVIVYFHYGTENLDHASRSQHLLATSAIDAGASLVLGTHPHKLQEIEHYKGGFIAYSLGNFVFDGFNEITNLSAILNVRLGKNGVIDFTWQPILLVDGLPRPADKENSEIILSLLKREYKVYPPGLDPSDVSE